METTQSKNIKDVLRWVLFIPGAVLSSYAAWLIINFLGRLSLGYVGVTIDDLIGKLYFYSAGSLAMGAVFVYAGAKIAPNKKVIISFILGGIAIVISGFLIFPGILTNNWWSIWSNICVVIGAGMVVWAVHTGELSFE